MTPKQRAFCREYVKDCNGTAAAKRAGYSARTANEQAAHLLAQADIRAEVQRLQAELAQAASVTVQTLLAEAEEARALAMANGQAAAAVAATTLKAKLTGNLIERREDAVHREAFERAKQQEGEIRTAAALLAEAAQSLGLPSTASPDAIVRAIAAAPILPPAAYLLVHAGRSDDDDGGDTLQ